jgi:pimeloyl-ACP methyl ester carboxylesterase
VVAVAGVLGWLAVATVIPVLGVMAVAVLVAGRLARGAARFATLRAVVAAAATLLGAAAGMAVMLLWWRGAPAAPDAFYDAPDLLPPRPGVLLRQEPFDRSVPPGARAWRILYTTARAEGAPAVASAVVLTPNGPSEAPRPLVVWTHGTTGVARGCAPSVLPPPFPFDRTVPAVAEAIAENWALLAPDYVGLGTPGSHPYLIGAAEARSALDAVRAARAMRDVRLDDRTVVWGHSQGGHAALWTGILAPEYAPEVGLRGVAALAPATDLLPLIVAAQYTPVGKIMASYVMAAYSNAYPDVRFADYVGPERRARAMASRCLSGPGALLSVLTAVTLEATFFARPPDQGPLAQRLRENTPDAPIRPPLLVAQGLADDLVLPVVQEEYVRRRCDAGQQLEYRTYRGLDHVGLVTSDSPLPEHLVDWTRARFAGAAAPRGCQVTAR